MFVHVVLPYFPIKISFQVKTVLFDKSLFSKATPKYGIVRFSYCYHLNQFALFWLIVFQYSSVYAFLHSIL